MYLCWQCNKHVALLKALPVILSRCPAQSAKDQHEPIGRKPKSRHNHETNKELLYLINQSGNPLRRAQWRQLAQDSVNWPQRNKNLHNVVSSLFCRLSSVYIILSPSSRLITMRSALYNSITFPAPAASFIFSRARLSTIAVLLGRSALMEPIT